MSAENTTLVSPPQELLSPTAFCLPASGGGGRDSYDMVTSPDARISALTVVTHDFWESLTFDEYNPVTKATTPHPRHGGDGGDHVFPLTLGTDEYIYGLEGRYGTYVDYVKFYIRDRKSGAFRMFEAGNPHG